MRYIQVTVKFETSFTYEVEDDEWDEDFEYECIEDTIETLAHPTSQYWQDAEYSVDEIFP